MKNTYWKTICSKKLSKSSEKKFFLMLKNIKEKKAIKIFKEEMQDNNNGRYDG